MTTIRRKPRTLTLAGGESSRVPAEARPMADQGWFTFGSAPSARVGIGAPAPAHRPVGARATANTSRDDHACHWFPRRIGT